MARALDKPFLTITIVLALVGFFIFSSASLGLLAREGIQLSAIAINQVFSLALGFALLYATSKVPFRFWNKIALFFLIGALGLTALVFVPALGFSHGGATRWLELGPLTFQPAEILKLAFVVYFAAWLAGVQRKVHKAKFSLLPLVLLLGVIGGLLVLQPDLGTFIVIAGTGVFMFIAGGGRWRHIIAFIVVSALILGLLGIFIPYVKGRLLTFVDPSRDPLGAGYQIQQSLIAVGSGKIVGRGFGQSVQKFNFLPEPVGDSIFAVFAEEWGFIGAVVLLMIFFAFALRGYRIAARAPTVFSALVVVGVVSMITIQSLINISSLVGIFPLTGMPLLFVSQGGSALIMALAGVGIVLSISREQRQLN